MRRTPGGAMGVSPSKGRPEAWANRWARVDPAGPAGSSSETNCSSTANHIDMDVNTLVTEASRALSRSSPTTTGGPPAPATATTQLRGGSTSAPTTAASKSVRESGLTADEGRGEGGRSWFSASYEVPLSFNMTTKTFADLGVDPALVDQLAEKGIKSPFPIQTLTIPDALAGRDVLGKAKTGSGKTLAFGLPLLQRLETARPKRPAAICLVPTRELATQVRDELAPLGEGTDVRVLAIYGGAPIEKQIKALDRGVELVVATPGRAIDLIERDALDLSEVTHIVIDEADRMADMGFLPQVEWILRNVEGKCQTLLFSATLDGVVNTLVSRYQEDPSFHEVASRGQTVEEMHHTFLKVHDRDKAKVASSIIKATGRVLVFCATKHGTDRVATRAERAGREGRGHARRHPAESSREGTVELLARASSVRWWPPTSLRAASTLTTWMW